MPAKAPRIEVGFYGIIQKVFQEKKRQVDLRKEPNIRVLLDTLCSSHERREKIFDEESNIRPDITILRNGRNISFLNGLDTELHDGDTVAIFPPMRGG